MNTKISLRLHWAHWIILSLSLFLTLFAWKYSQNLLQEKMQIKFDRDADHIIELVAERMQKYEMALWSGVAAIQSNGGTINHIEWKVFSNHLKLEERYPGINGIGVIYYFKKNKLQSFIKHHKALRPHFNIYPMTERKEYLPITYIEPVGLNQKALGLDMAHENNRYTAALKARDSGKAIITGPIILVQDSEKTPGFLFYAPFYSEQQDQPLGNKEKKFLGMVYAPFTVKKLLQGTLQQDKRLASIKISDLTEVMYNENTVENDNFDINAMFKKTLTLSLYGRNWTFDLHSTKAFRNVYSNNQPNIILVAGIVIDILLLVLFVSLSQSNKNAIMFANRMLKKAEHQKAIAIQSAKLAALGEMAGGVAHEINNPLAIISLNFDLLKSFFKKQPLIEPAILKSLTKIESTIDRIRKIVNSMRSLSRNGTQDAMENITVEELIDEVLGICSEKFKIHGVDLKVDIKDSKMNIKCRHIEISQVIINLLNNAFDAVKKLKNPWVSIDGKVESGKLVLMVTDCGRGIPVEIQEKLLQPFFTTKNEGEGTGIGLSISNTIVQSHNGVLFIDKACPNTRFVVELPLQQNDPI